MTAVLSRKNFLTALSIFGLAVLTVLLVQSGIFSSQEKMELFLKQAGCLAPVLFILLQIVQVIIPVLPGAVSCVIGVALFGPLFGFLYNYIGMVIGSALAFLLVRRYGVSMILRFVPEKEYQKYVSWLEKGRKFDLLFGLAILLPGAPDDLLCMIAGLTPMSFPRFLAIYLLGKPVSLLGYSVGMNAVMGILKIS